ncbi:DUF6355 family natural product biosynthesis protein [Streptomyces xiangluensis]|uniref:DUF6355 family natural product biosynthesis protein n=1 Tax=Streptomyces xiangluensis TaxID=2665720 RepID=A0ABV8YKC8_9ACTN
MREYQRVRSKPRELAVYPSVAASIGWERYSMRHKLKAAGAAVCATFSLALLPGSASAAGNDVSIQACGYYETQTDAYYGHCVNNPPPNVGARLQVDYDWTPFDGYACVRPGETHLGSTSEIDNAWYIGTCWYG